MLATILNFILGLVTLIISYLPNADYHIVDRISGVDTLVKDSLTNINYLFPVNTLFIILTIVINLYILKYTFKLVRYILNFIPFVNSN
jgi:hypothetical protein